MYVKLLTAGLEETPQNKLLSFFAKLYHAFVGTDASLIEVNPLVITGSGDVMALDAKLNFDPNALYRQKEVSEMRDKDEEDPQERDATEAGLSYVSLDGNIGCLVARCWTRHGNHGHD